MEEVGKIFSKENVGNVLCVLNYGSYWVPDLELRCTAGVTGRHGMPSPSRHLTPLLVYPQVHICSHFLMFFQNDLSDR
jgi:hypothetical protein